MTDPTLYQRPAELLSALIRFDTTNPPGNEAACLAYCADALRAVGVEAQLVGKDPARPNLLARLPGRGDAPPLLLQGHVDVVTTANQTWQRDPFGGELVDGWVWGRGALDMKGGVVMLLCAVLRAAAEGFAPPGDLLLALMSDEEVTSEYGAGYLVEQQAHQFAGVRHALGEFGGFSLHLGGKRFYPIMLGERSPCPLHVTVRGPGGHGAQPLRGGAMAKAGRLLLALDSALLPVNITPIVRAMVETMADAFEGDLRDTLLRVLDPAQTDAALDALGDPARLLRPLVRNTANATLIHGGHKLNVLPTSVEIQIDARMLPGVTPDELLAQVRALIGEGPEVAFGRTGKGGVVGAPDLTHFGTLGDILRAADPGAIPLPYVVSGSTDASIFARLGIQTYGFLPMRLPADFDFARTIHAADERIPVDALAFGVAALWEAVQRVGAR